MAATLFADPHQAYVPVGELLPTDFDAQGWSSAKLVCTAGQVNIFPHCFIAPRGGRPGYWLQVGEPGQVPSVTHWREFPAGPAPVRTITLSPTAHVC